MIINNKTNVIEVQSQWNQAGFEPRILQSTATRSAIWVTMLRYFFYDKIFNLIIYFQLVCLKAVQNTVLDQV